VVYTCVTEWVRVFSRSARRQQWRSDVWRCWWGIPGWRRRQLQWRHGRDGDVITRRWRVGGEEGVDGIERKMATGGQRQSGSSETGTCTSVIFVRHAVHLYALAEKKQ